MLSRVIVLELIMSEIMKLAPSYCNNISSLIAERKICEYRFEVFSTTQLENVIQVNLLRNGQHGPQHYRDSAYKAGSSTF